MLSSGLFQIWETLTTLFITMQNHFELSKAVFPILFISRICFIHQPDIFTFFTPLHCQLPCCSLRGYIAGISSYTNSLGLIVCWKAMEGVGGLGHANPQRMQMGNVENSIWFKRSLSVFLMYIARMFHHLWLRSINLSESMLKLGTMIVKLTIFMGI